ncbi:hypothetical protein ACTXT7_010870 [Hymenolepis weldensis]
MWFMESGTFSRHYSASKNMDNSISPKRVRNGFATLLGQTEAHTYTQRRQTQKPIRELIMAVG